MHDCAVGCDGSAHDGALLVEVDDDNVIGFVYFFTNTIKRRECMRQIVLKENKTEVGIYQMKWSLSIVRVLKPIEEGCTPSDDNCKSS